MHYDKPPEQHYRRERNGYVENGYVEFEALADNGKVAYMIPDPPAALPRRRWLNEKVRRSIGNRLAQLASTLFLRHVMLAEQYYLALRATPVERLNDRLDDFQAEISWLSMSKVAC